MVLKIHHPQCLHAHLCLLLDLTSFIRQMNITTKLINLLVFMVFSATVYAKTSPFLVILLGTSVILTLRYLAVAQSRHIKQNDYTKMWYQSEILPCMHLLCTSKAWRPMLNVDTPTLRTILTALLELPSKVTRGFGQVTCSMEE